MPPDAGRPSLRARIRAGETTLGAFCNLGSALTAELLGRAGYDWLILDLEHGALTEAELIASLQAVDATPATAVVRVEEGTRLRIGRALDAGARALMVPRVESAADAERIVSWVRYPPTGVRGVALPTRGAGYGELGHAGVAGFHEEICLMLQVESEQALADAARIAAVDGVDVLFVGPSDLSHSLGVGGDIEHARYAEALARVGQAAAEAGKAAGVLLWSLDDLDRHVALGYRVIAAGSDGGFVTNAARALVTEFRARVAG